MCRGGFFGCHFDSGGCFRRGWDGKVGGSPVTGRTECCGVCDGMFLAWSLRAQDNGPSVGRVQCVFGGSGEIWCCWLGWGFGGGEDVDVDEPVGYFGPVEVAGEGFVVGAAEDAVDVGSAVFDFAGAGH